MMESTETTGEEDPPPENNETETTNTETQESTVGTDLETNTEEELKKELKKQLEQSKTEKTNEVMEKQKDEESDLVNNGEVETTPMGNEEETKPTPLGEEEKIEPTPIGEKTEPKDKKLKGHYTPPDELKDEIEDSRTSSNESNTQEDKTKLEKVRDKLQQTKEKFKEQKERAKKKVGDVEEFMEETKAEEHGLVPGQKKVLEEKRGRAQESKKETERIQEELMKETEDFNQMVEQREEWYEENIKGKDLTEISESKLESAKEKNMIDEQTYEKTKYYRENIKGKNLFNLPRETMEKAQEKGLVNDRTLEKYNFFQENEEKLEENLTDLTDKKIETASQLDIISEEEQKEIEEAKEQEEMVESAKKQGLVDKTGENNVELVKDLGEVSGSGFSLLKEIGFDIEESKYKKARNMEKAENQGIVEKTQDGNYKVAKNLSELTEDEVNTLEKAGFEDIEQGVERDVWYDKNIKGKNLFNLPENTLDKAKEKEIIGNQMAQDIEFYKENFLTEEGGTKDLFDIPKKTVKEAEQRDLLDVDVGSEQWKESKVIDELRDKGILDEEGLDEDLGKIEDFETVEKLNKIGFDISKRDWKKSRQAEIFDQMGILEETDSGYKLSDYPAELREQGRIDEDYIGKLQAIGFDMYEEETTDTKTMSVPAMSFYEYEEEMKEKGWDVVESGSYDDGSIELIAKKTSKGLRDDPTDDDHAYSRSYKIAHGLDPDKNYSEAVENTEEIINRDIQDMDNQIGEINPNDDLDTIKARQRLEERKEVPIKELQSGRFRVGEHHIANDLGAVEEYLQNMDYQPKSVKLQDEGKVEVPEKLTGDLGKRFEKFAKKKNEYESKLHDIQELRSEQLLTKENIEQHQQEIERAQKAINVIEETEDEEVSQALKDQYGGLIEEREGGVRLEKEEVSRLEELREEFGELKTEEKGLISSLSSPEDIKKEYKEFQKEWKETQEEKEPSMDPYAESMMESTGFLSPRKVKEQETKEKETIEQTRRRARGQGFTSEVEETEIGSPASFMSFGALSQGLSSMESVWGRGSEKVSQLLDDTSEEREQSQYAIGGRAAKPTDEEIKKTNTGEKVTFEDIKEGASEFVQNIFDQSGEYARPTEGRSKQEIVEEHQSEKPMDIQEEMEGFGSEAYNPQRIENKISDIQETKREKIEQDSKRVSGSENTLESNLSSLSNVFEEGTFTENLSTDRVEETQFESPKEKAMEYAEESTESEVRETFVSNLGKDIARDFVGLYQEPTAKGRETTQPNVEESGIQKTQDMFEEIGNEKTLKDYREETEETRERMKKLRESDYSPEDVDPLTKFTLGVVSPATDIITGGETPDTYDVVGGTIEEKTGVNVPLTSAKRGKEEREYFIENPAYAAGAAVGEGVQDLLAGIGIAKGSKYAGRVATKVPGGTKLVSKADEVAESVTRKADDIVMRAKEKIKGKPAWDKYQRVRRAFDVGYKTRPEDEVIVPSKGTDVDMLDVAKRTGQEESMISRTETTDFVNKRISDLDETGRLGTTREAAERQKAIEDLRTRLDEYPEKMQRNPLLAIKEEQRAMKEAGKQVDELVSKADEPYEYMTREAREESFNFYEKTDDRVFREISEEGEKAKFIDQDGLRGNVEVRNIGEKGEVSITVPQGDEPVTETQEKALRASELYGNVRDIFEETGTRARGTEVRSLVDEGSDIVVHGRRTAVQDFGGPSGGIPMEDLTGKMYKMGRKGDASEILIKAQPQPRDVGEEFMTGLGSLASRIGEKTQAKRMNEERTENIGVGSERSEGSQGKTGIEDRIREEYERIEPGTDKIDKFFVGSEPEKIEDISKGIGIGLDLSGGMFEGEREKAEPEIDRDIGQGPSTDEGMDTDQGQDMRTGLGLRALSKQLMETRVEAKQKMDMEQKAKSDSKQKLDIETRLKMDVPGKAPAKAGFAGGGKTPRIQIEEEEEEKKPTSIGYKRSAVEFKLPPLLRESKEEKKKKAPKLVDEEKTKNKNNRENTKKENRFFNEKEGEKKIKL